MKAIVTGGRSFVHAHTESVLDHFLPGSGHTIVQGGAGGADRTARQWAKSRGHVVRTFQADWSRNGKIAGPMRNQEMIDGGADLVIAFPGGAGTADCVNRARSARLPVVVVTEGMLRGEARLPDLVPPASPPPPKEKSPMPCVMGSPIGCRCLVCRPVRGITVARVQDPKDHPAYWPTYQAAYALWRRQTDDVADAARFAASEAEEAVAALVARDENAGKP